MCGVRVYEPEDYDRAIELAASGALPLNELITERLPLDALPDAFARLTAGTDAVKILIDTQGNSIGLWDLSARLTFSSTTYNRGIRGDVGFAGRS